MDPFDYWICLEGEMGMRMGLGMGMRIGMESDVFGYILKRMIMSNHYNVW